MNLWESVLVSLESLRGNKLRSFLTIIGIVVGVAAVVTVISIGQAGKTSLVSDIDKYGEGFFIVIVDTSQGSAILDSASPTLSDLDTLNQLPGMVGVSGEQTSMIDAKSGKDTYQFVVNATTAKRTGVETIEMTAGRFFTAEEERARQKVIVVESDFATKAYGGSQSAIGKKVVLNNAYYKIIGVTKSQKSLFSSPNKKQFSVYAPILSMPLPDGGSGNKLNTLYLKADTGDPALLKATIEKVKKTLAKRHNVPATAYYSQTGADAQEMVKSVFNVLQIIIGSIAGISLLVGGIGVMNIMLVSVTERTREIGIRKAIGATPGVIMSQFLIEAVVLCFLGGLVGTLIGLSCTYLFSLITNWPYLVSWWAIVLAFGFSAGVGLFFGIYPASKAARLQPIESLRYE
jgi:putative ABC transport system permease protein